MPGTPAAASLSPGDEVGGAYEIVAPLSHGAMGAVYEARHVAAGEHVALKVCLDEENEERFEIEGRLLAQLSHPRVVRVLDSFIEDDMSCLVMELVAGEDLSDALDDRGSPGLPHEEAVARMAEVCEALDYVHTERVVHRDVKPANVIVSGAGAVLVDFGIARTYTGIDEGTIAIGTPGFMAPEIFGGGIVTPRSDVFSAAATLWTVLTGRPPRYGDPEPLEWSVKGVPEEIEFAMRRALAVEPADRTPSVLAFAADLGAAVAAGGVPLARTADEVSAPRTLLEALVKAAAGVFDAAAASIALLDPRTGKLVYEAAWGAGASEIVGVRLDRGQGIAGAVASSGEGLAIPSCRTDHRFAASVAAGTGYVPNTMIVLPLRRGGETVGVLSVLDRRDGLPFGPADLARADAFGDLAVLAVAAERDGGGTRAG